MEYEKITKVYKNSQNNSETVTNENENENDREIPNERCVSPEERQEIIDELRLKKYNNEIPKN